MLEVRPCLTGGVVAVALALSGAAWAQIGVVCTNTGGGGCQLPDQMGHDGVVAATSDADPEFGFAVADNFSPAASGQVTTVCWWGVYTDFTTDCGGTPPADSFTITFFTDEPAVPGSIPSSTVLAGPFAVTPMRAATGNVVPSGIGDLTEFEYTATLPNAVNVLVNRCFWMQIQNDTTGNACAWLWSTAPPGDANAAQQDDGAYDAPGDVTGYDLAWCLNIAVVEPGACIPAACGDPLSGPCDEANGSPGCDDQACCNAVCGDDPFCCSQEWDDNCVDQAFGADGLCVVAACGSPATGDCFVANGTPFCEDVCGPDACPGCCDIVCAVDPYCCGLLPGGNWDGLCAGEAMDLCVDCPPGSTPANDECENATPIALGATPITNNCATPGALGHGVPCNDGFSVGMGLDVWYLLSANVTDELLVLPTPDAGTGWLPQVAVYQDNDCNALEDPPLACNSVGAGGVVVPVVSGVDYLIRVGGRYDGAAGTGTLVVAPVPASCGTGGSCLEPGVGAGCSNTVCCALVCLEDATCCDSVWDQACADLAATTCSAQPCGPIDLAPATLTEPEACGADLNGGCNLDPPAFTAVTDGEVIAGTAWADAGTRDTDWYLLDNTELDAADANANGTVDVHYVVQSELPIVSFFIEDSAADCSGDEAVVGTVGFGKNCVSITPGLVTVTLDPLNRYVVFAGTGNPDGTAIFEGFPCVPGPGFTNSYLLCVNVTDDGAGGPVTPCADVVVPCPWDCQVAPDGNVGINDLLDLLAQWGGPGGCDFDGGGVGITDLLKLLAQWGPCD